MNTEDLEKILAYLNYGNVNEVTLEYSKLSLNEQSYYKNLNLHEGDINQFVKPKKVHLYNSGSEDISTIIESYLEFHNINMPLDDVEITEEIDYDKDRIPQHKLLPLAPFCSKFTESFLNKVQKYYIAFLFSNKYLTPNACSELTRNEKCVNYIFEIHQMYIESGDPIPITSMLEQMLKFVKPRTVLQKILMNTKGNKFYEI